MTEGEIERTAPPEMAGLPEEFWRGGKLVTPRSEREEGGTTCRIEGRTSSITVTAALGASLYRAIRRPRNNSSP